MSPAPYAPACGGQHCPVVAMLLAPRSNPLPIPETHRCCGCGASLRFRSVSRLRVQIEAMKAMRCEVSLGECCFSSSRTPPLSATPRLPSLRQHAPLGSPQAPRPPGRMPWLLLLNLHFHLR